MKYYDQLRDRFRQVFEAKWGRDELDNYEELRDKFAFHMADVAKNFTDLAQAYADANTCDVACLSKRAEMFFSHCLPHLMAAGQIYDEIPQIFEEQKGVHDWQNFTDNEGA